jgi:hypothetical protein
LKNIE